MSVVKDSIFVVTSPTKRRESTPLLEKIKTDVSMTKLKLSSTWKKEEKAKEVKDDSPILKYLTSQVRSGFVCPSPQKRMRNVIGVAFNVVYR